MTRTYPDSDILIAAAKGNEDISEAAIALLEDPEREFVASTYTIFETLATALHNGFSDQAEFYERFFDDIEEWAITCEDVLATAYNESVDCGVHGFDAFHVAAAISLNADELVTGERSTSMLANTPNIHVVSMRT